MILQLCAYFLSCKVRKYSYFHTFWGTDQNLQISYKSMNNMNNSDMILKRECLDRMKPYYIKILKFKVNEFSIKMVLQLVFFGQKRKEKLTSQSKSKRLCKDGALTFFPGNIKYHKFLLPSSKFLRDLLAFIFPAQ